MTLDNMDYILELQFLNVRFLNYDFPYLLSVYLYYISSLLPQRKSRVAVSDQEVGFE